MRHPVVVHLTPLFRSCRTFCVEKLSVLLLWFVPFVFSLSFHECAHAWTANRYGDPTAKFLGRLTLNPLSHADMIGTILFPLISFITGFPLIGWAKPVPVNERNLKTPRRDAILVAAAGPVSNLILALAFTVVFYLLNRMSGFSGASINAGFMVQEPLMVMAIFGIRLNVTLALFNLLPLPPLDGGRVAAGFFPSFAYHFSVMERYGSFILLLLLYTRVVDILVFVPSQIFSQFLMGFAV